MKKKFLGILALASMALTSCNTDVDDTVGTFTYPQYSLVTDLDNGKIKAVESSYTIFNNQTKGLASISTNVPFTFDDVKYSFATDTVAMKWNALNTPDGRAEVAVISGVKANVNGDPSLPLRNFMCEIAYFIYPNSNLPVIKDVPKVTTTPQSLLIDYNIGDRFSVKTFLKDTFYAGKTVTSYPGDNGALATYSNTEMFYRVILDVQKNTAKVVMYLARFSEKMPKSMNIVLDDLPVTWMKGGYMISATDIVPKVAEGSGLTENENYTFKTFSFRFDDSRLTTASISYNVKGIYQGSFVGSCLMQYKSDTGM